VPFYPWNLWWLISFCVQADGTPFLCIGLFYTLGRQPFKWVNSFGAWTPWYMALYKFTVGSLFSKIFASGLLFHSCCPLYTRYFTGFTSLLGTLLPLQPCILYLGKSSSRGRRFANMRKWRGKALVDPCQIHTGRAKKHRERDLARCLCGSNLDGRKEAKPQSWTRHFSATFRVKMSVLVISIHVGTMRRDGRVVCAGGPLS